ncbi:DUF4123 domain-containing protein [Pseudomonas putida]|uniref:DUF4123 domain-containing protein n=1 Tax=Pseudomonas putida TaxID=303 RepID=A0A2Z4RTQ0_PSEPU|nr:DUF4123 domain-containing protein [Pseudomonas putida]AWY44247.1 DUF4123 domain-containing protein [Pseudomonas putida]
MTTVDNGLWIELLEASCAQSTNSCLDIIIDQTGSEMPLLGSVLSVEPALPWHSLFSDLPEAGAEDLAPLLVRVDLSIPLQRQWLIGLMQALNRDSRLLVLASNWPFPALAEYLGRCLEACNGGQSGLLRYYDPRLFPLMFSHVLEPQQQRLLLRPAVFWSWLDRDGRPQRLVGTCDEPVWPEERRPIVLSDSQLETFRCVSDATGAMKKLGKAIPPQLSAEQRFQTCFAAMLEATEDGLFNKPEREARCLERLRNACMTPNSEIRK